MQTQTFHELIEKYLDERAGIEERRQLATFLQDPSYLELLDDLVMKQLSARMYEFEPDQHVQHSIDQYIDQQTIPFSSRSSNRVHFLRKWGWVAALIIASAGTTYFLTPFKNTGQQVATANRSSQTEILPGGEKAILTLADGSRIVLDTTANDTLALQGNAAIVKLANGEIAYQPVGALTTGVMMNTMSTPRGGQYRLTLPDGSKVWLNAASSITYPTAFAGTQRKVTVKGEVYFEVITNKQKPFMVDISGLSTVEVLGTHFNINSYPDESAVKTTLLEGSVKVMSRAANAETPGSDNKESWAILRPGQQAQLLADKATISVRSDIDVEAAIAWKNGLFIFSDDDIKTVMGQIGRWYDVEIVYDHPSLSKRFVAEISRSLPVSKVLRLLELTGDVHFKTEGKKITVLR